VHRSGDGLADLLIPLTADGSEIVAPGCPAGRSAAGRSRRDPARARAARCRAGCIGERTAAGTSSRVDASSGAVHLDAGEGSRSSRRAKGGGIAGSGPESIPASRFSRRMPVGFVAAPPEATGATVRWPVCPAGGWAGAAFGGWLFCGWDAADWGAAAGSAAGGAAAGVRRRGCGFSPLQGWSATQFRLQFRTPPDRDRVSPSLNRNRGDLPAHRRDTGTVALRFPSRRCLGRP